MVVMYKTAGEYIVTDEDNEQTLIDKLFTPKEGRKVTNYQRVTGDIMVIPHNLVVYYTTLDE